MLHGQGARLAVCALLVSRADPARWSALIAAALLLAGAACAARAGVSVRFPLGCAASEEYKGLLLHVLEPGIPFSNEMRAVLALRPCLLRCKVLPHSSLSFTLGGSEALMVRELAHECGGESFVTSVTCSRCAQLCYGHAFGAHVILIGQRLARCQSLVHALPVSGRRLDLIALQGACLAVFGVCSPAPCCRFAHRKRSSWSSFGERPGCANIFF